MGEHNSIQLLKVCFLGCWRLRAVKKHRERWEVVSLSAAK